MAKLKTPCKEGLEYLGEGHEEYCFFCPACSHTHRVVVKWGKLSGRTEPIWYFNGDMESPTFYPEIKVDSLYKCISRITNGNILFTNSSTHGMAGQKVPLPEMKD